jgi:hypothetical protein
MVSPILRYLFALSEPAAARAFFRFLALPSVRRSAGDLWTQRVLAKRLGRFACVCLEPAAIAINHPADADRRSDPNIRGQAVRWR